MFKVVINIFFKVRFLGSFGHMAVKASTVLMVDWQADLNKGFGQQGTYVVNPYLTSLL